MLDIAQQSFVPQGLASNGYSAHDSSRQCPHTEPSSLSHRFRLTLLNGSLINGVTTWGTRLVFLLHRPSPRHGRDIIRSTRY